MLAMELGFSKRRNGGDLVAVLVLSCLLLLPLLVSSRSLQLSSQQQQHPPSLNLSADEMVASAAAARGLGRRPAARMNVEVNDYPGSGPNTRHDPPKAPGRP